MTYIIGILGAILEISLIGYLLQLAHILVPALILLAITAIPAFIIMVVNHRRMQAMHPNHR